MPTNSPHHKRGTPKPESTVKIDIRELAPDPTWLKNGWLAWPDIFCYHWLGDGGAQCKSPCPPQDAMPYEEQLRRYLNERGKPGSTPHPDKIRVPYPYTTIIFPGKLAHYELLKRMGKTLDPRHLGKDGGVSEDYSIYRK